MADQKLAEVLESAKRLRDHGPLSMGSEDAALHLAQATLDLVIELIEHLKGPITETGIGSSPPFSIERGEHGLYYLTSSAMKGLLVSGDSVAQVMERLPQAIEEMRAAKAQHERDGNG